jgi:hypothetical protein
MGLGDIFDRFETMEDGKRRKVVMKEDCMTATTLDVLQKGELQAVLYDLDVAGFFSCDTDDTVANELVRRCPGRHAETAVKCRNAINDNLSLAVSKRKRSERNGYLTTFCSGCNDVNTTHRSSKHRTHSARCADCTTKPLDVKQLKTKIKLGLTSNHGREAPLNCFDNVFTDHPEFLSSMDDNLVVCKSTGRILSIKYILPICPAEDMDKPFAEVNVRKDQVFVLLYSAPGGAYDGKEPFSRPIKEAYHGTVANLVVDSANRHLYDIHFPDFYQVSSGKACSHCIDEFWAHPDPTEEEAQFDLVIDHMKASYQAVQMIPCLKGNYEPLVGGPHVDGFFDNMWFCCIANTGTRGELRNRLNGLPAYKPPDENLRDDSEDDSDDPDGDKETELEKQERIARAKVEGEGSHEDDSVGISDAESSDDEDELRDDRKRKKKSSELDSESDSD